MFLGVCKEVKSHVPFQNSWHQKFLIRFICLGNLLFKNARNYKTSIVSVTESWGQEGKGDVVFNMKDFNMYRDYRKGRIGSGTLMYIRKCLGQRRCWPMTRFANREDYDSSVWCWVHALRFVLGGASQILSGVCFYEQ